MRMGRRRRLKPRCVNEVVEVDEWILDSPRSSANISASTPRRTSTSTRRCVQTLAIVGFSRARERDARRIARPETEPKSKRGFDAIPDPKP